jgi:6-phosphogluconolactonase
MSVFLKNSYPPLLVKQVLKSNALIAVDFCYLSLMKKWLLLFSLLLCMKSMCQHFYLLAGTYTGNGSKGIYVYDFDAKNGTVQLISHTDSAENPSYLCVSANGKFLYAVNEVNTEKSGWVAAYRFNQQSGQLEFLNRERSGGAHPCHVSITRDGKWVLVANYTGGSLSAMPIAHDGRIQPLQQNIPHIGTSINKTRQERAHVHAVMLSPDEKYLLTPDLGTDQLHVYQFNGKTIPPLRSAPEPFTASSPGSGPRHLTFSADGRFVYVVEELSGTLSAYSFQRGKLKLIDSYPGHLKQATTDHGSADVHLSPDGRYLYMSNRGIENTIAIFSVDAVTGRLTPAGIVSTKGNHPRNFIIDPTGRYLLVGNMKSNEVVIFKRNIQTGQLDSTGHFNIPSPACLKMIPR